MIFKFYNFLSSSTPSPLLQEHLAGGRRGREELDMSCVLSLHWPGPGTSLQERGLTVLLLHLVGLDMVRLRMENRRREVAQGLQQEKDRWEAKEEVRRLEKTGGWQEIDDTWENLEARSGLAFGMQEEARGWQEEEGGEVIDRDTSCSKHWQHHKTGKYNELEDGLPATDLFKEVDEKKSGMYNILGHPMLWHQLPLTDL